MGIGDRIKNRREELGLSQDELAEKMGYKSRSTIAKIEKGVNDVAQKTTVKFAEALNTSVAYLMGWNEEENKKEPAPEDEFSETKQQLLDLISGLSESEAAVLLASLKSALGKQ